MELKHVIIECPYDSWSDPQVQKLFAQTILLRRDGYLKEFPYGVMPFDTTDFVSTQHLICDVSNNDLNPIMCWKSISAGRCAIHDLPFPPVSILQSIGANEHLEVIKETLDRNKKTPDKVIYSSTMTILPQLRKDRELVKTLWERAKFGFNYYDVEYGINDSFMFASNQFKIPRFFESIGFSKILNKEKSLLPVITHPNKKMKNCDATILLRSEITSEENARVSKHQSWLDSVIQIKSDPEFIEKYYKESKHIAA